MKKRLINILTLTLLLFISCKKDEEEVIPSINEEPTEITLDGEITPYTLTASMEFIMETNKPAEEIGFFWSDQPGVDSTDVKFTELEESGDSYFGNLHGLLPDKTYYTKPFAVIANETYIGTEQSFKTKPLTFDYIGPEIEGPRVAGRLEAVEIKSDAFSTVDKSSVAVFVGGIETTGGEWLADTWLRVKLSDNTPFGADREIKLVVSGQEIVLDEKIFVSRYSRLKDFAFQNIRAETFAVNGKGYTTDGTTIYAYDPDTDTFSELETAPYDMGWLQSFVIGDKAYLGIGSSNGLYEFDPSTKVLTEREDYPDFDYLGSRYGAAFSISGKGYYGLGYKYDIGVPTERPEILAYDPAADEWTEVTEFPGQIVHTPASFSIGNLAFVCGGFIGHEDYYDPSQEFWAYDVVNDSWEQYPDFPGELTRYGFTGFSFEGNAYIISGHEIWKYDLSANAWSKYEENMRGIEDRLFTRVFVIGSGIYIGSGSDASSILQNDFYRFFPE